ncbi:crossover junction endodeoxyribonuclease RuvC [Candidatus Daviesbacteria bacterium]|nr:crossover junction endodeoxyribonuclease RuvC [Candidatus Daviesbacteria bacterium]
MIILGIDPGTATTGWGLIKVPDDILGRQFEYGIELISYGNIFTDKDKPMAERLWKLSRELDDLIKKYQPDQIVTEMLFFGANLKTAIMVGQARGIVLMSSAKYRVPITEYTGLQVKLMVAGAGRADKAQVHEGVRRFLGSNGRRRKALKVNWVGGHLDDATDALAIAICHVLKLVSK